LLVSAQNGRDFIKLADFGLARLYLASTLSGMTLTGHVAGTVGYMAPEQVADLRHAGPAADQYSAGATLYYLLTGKNPFPLQGQLEDQLIEIVDRQPIPIQQQRNDIPDELAVIVHRSLAKKPTGRFRDVSVLKAALIPFLEPDQYSETTHPGSGPSRSLHR
jgi:serine/threonine-protein kinase